MCSSIYDDKEKIKEHIKNCITRQSSLNETKVYICKEIKRDFLSSFEEHYINHKYVKYCLRGWFQELSEKLKNYKQNETNNLVENIIKIKTIEDKHLNDLSTKHFQLIIENIHLLLKNDCDFILIQLKEYILNYYKQTIEQQNELLSKTKDEIEKFFSIYEYHQLINEDEFLAVKNMKDKLLDIFIITDMNASKNDLWTILFHPKRISKELLPTMMQNISNIRKQSTLIKELNEAYSTENYTKEISNMISYNLTSVTIKRYTYEKQNILIINGVHIVLSLIWSKLKENLIESKSTCIYLIALENLFLDCDFKNETWHGKNLGIHGKRIVIIGKRTINVSGLHGEPQTRPSKAENGQTNGNKNGQHGQNGSKGESGGNITIITERIENEDKLSLKSNGGNGGFGQDGGDAANGENGSDGIGLTLDRFKQEFPSTSKLIGEEAAENVRNTYNYIRRISAKIHHDKMNEPNKRLKACYIEGETKAGNHIYFSFYRSALSGCESYCFCTGTCGNSGEPGGFGGSGGYAGEPGYGGDIKIYYKSNEESKINVLAIDGQQAYNGKSGRDGKSGKPGENHPDVGYIDFQFWTDAKYYGPSWLKLVPHREADSDRIRDAEYENEKLYTAIEDREEPEALASVTFDEKAKQNYQKSKKSKQKATRQCVIANEHLLDTLNAYQCQLSTNSIQSLTLNLDRLQEQIVYSQTDKIQTENENISITKSFINEKHLKLKRNQNHIQINQFIPSNLLGNFQILYDKDDKQTLNYILDMINELKYNVYNDKEILYIHDSIKKLEFIWEKDNLHFHEYQNLKTLVINKFKLTVLAKLAEFIDNNPMNMIDEWIREDTYPGNHSAIHAVLGTKNEFNIYEYRQCEVLRNSLKENLIRIVNKNTEVVKYLHQSIKYLIETNENKEKFPCMQQFYKIFLKDNLNSADNNNEITNNSKYYIDENTLREYADYISQNEYSFSQYDMILLAYDNDICLNIYMFSHDHRNQYDLIRTYNKNSTNIQHVLDLGDEFVKLSIRKVENQNEKYLSYKQILHGIQQISQTDQLTEYSNKKSFESHAYEEQIEDDSEETIINEISEYFPIDARRAIRLVLIPISSKFLPKFHLLKSMKNRFDIEKSCVTQEMITLLSMSIINSHTNDEDLTIYQWIVNAYSPKEWINELALMKFEKITNESWQKLPLWRSKLRAIKNKRLVEILMMKIEDLNENFQLEKLLSQIEECHLTENEFVDMLLDIPLNQWSIQLEHLSFLQKIHYALYTYDFKDDQLSSIIYYLHSLKAKSEIFVDRLLENFQKKTFKNEDIVRICSKFYSNEWQFDEEMINNIENQIFTNQHSSSENSERTRKKLFELIDRDKYTTIKENMNNLKIFFQNLNEYQFSNINQQDFKIDDIKQWVMKFKSQSRQYQIDHLHISLYMIEKAIRIFFPQIPSLRQAQKLTIASFITSKNNLLAQVATGEGKSLIIASIMIIKCLLGEKGDIITSSPILAERDANEYNELYQLFDISVSHNASDDCNQREHAYQSDLVYGDLASFQRDFLLDRFYNQNILGNRYQNERTNIFVDEVDSMLLDKGNTVLYLSRQLPSLDTLESVYIFIWQMIHNDLLTGNYSSIDDIEKAVLHNLYPILTKKDLTQITSDEQTLDEIWNELIENHYIDNDGQILSCQIIAKNHILQSYNNHLEYLLNEIFQYERQIQIPNYLKPFVKKHLLTWIHSAFQALNMEDGKNYIIDTNRNTTQFDKHPNIIIIDCDTGVDQINSQWNECLHQFLQLKHQCKTSLLSLKAVFISNISFFNMYEHIYGVSGTLGSEYERDFLRTIYHVDFLTVPQAYPSRFHEDRPKLCKDIFEWKNEIIQQSIRLSETRSVLIICQTIKDLQQLNEALQSKNHFTPENIFIYKRSYEKFSFNEHQYLQEGQIILATNLAGRGTDIKISDELNKNGGLHVILSYLPDNYRIEQQAFGRTARKGQYGSGQLILIDQTESSSSTDTDSLLGMIDLKNQRDFNEMCRIGQIRQHYQESIQFEEDLFGRFHQAFSHLKEKLDHQSEITMKRKEIILNSLLNQWAFWLDKINFIMDNKLEIFQSLEQNRAQLEQVIDFNQLVTEPNQLIKLSKCFIKEENYDKASQLLQIVIDQEPMFSHAAYYYKAHCLIKQTQLSNNEQKIEFHRLLDHAEYLFNYHIDILVSRNTILNQFNSLNQPNLTIDSYRKQNETLCNLYSCFIQSIHDLRGHSITSNIFVNIDINEHLAMRIYKQLFDSDKKIFIRKQFNKNFNENQLKKICMDYQFNENEFKQYLSEGDYVNEDVLKNYLRFVRTPNREDFWQLMVEKKILTNVEDVIIVNTNQINETNEKFKEFIRFNEDKFESIQKLLSTNQTILFFHNMKLNIEDFHYLTGSPEKYDRIFEEEKLVLLNKIARIDMNQFQQQSIREFQSVSSKDFMQIEGLNQTECNEIYNQLLEQNIINQTGILLTNNFENIQFAKYQIYQQRILTIIKYQCLYQSQILDLFDQINPEEKNMLYLTLPHDLHKNLLYDLESALIIKPVYLNTKQIDLRFYEKLLSTTFLEKLGKIIQEVCQIDESKAKSVAKALENTIGKLHYLSQANSYLNDLKENFNSNQQFEHIQGLELFRINGLDHVMNVEEKKWTWQMWLSSGTIFLFGFVEVVGGIYLELYTVGCGTHIAAGLISEGLNDILYACSAIAKGSFNWNDYFVNKIHSILITIATGGISALLSRGVRYSRFGSKIFGNNQQLSRLAGKNLLKQAGSSTMKKVTINVHKQVWCRIGEKLVEGVAFGATNAAISFASEKFLKGYCGKILNELILNIKQSIEERRSEIHESIAQIYRTYGANITQRLLEDISQANNSKQWYHQALEYIKKIAQIVSSGINNSLKKSNYANQSNSSMKIFSLLTNILSPIMKAAPYIKAMIDIGLTTKRFLNDRIEKLKDGAKKCQEGQVDIDENWLNGLINHTIEQWSQEIENLIDTDVRTKIIEPILSESTSFLLRKLGKNIRQLHQRRKDETLLRKFQSNKKEYEKQIEHLVERQEQSINQNEVLHQITNKYHQNLLILMAKTKNPKLIASIIAEGGPMDMICIQAMAHMYQKPIRINNADGQNYPDLIYPQGKTITDLNHENCISIDFIPGDGENTFGHFVASGQASEDQIDTNDNNCLIHAIAKAAKTNQYFIDVNNIRQKIVQTIENDEYIRKMIENGHHRYYISQSVFGGNGNNKQHKFSINNIREKLNECSISLSANHNLNDQPTHVLNDLMEKTDRLRSLIKKNNFREKLHETLSGSVKASENAIPGLQRLHALKGELEGVFTIDVPYESHHNIHPNQHLNPGVTRYIFEWRDTNNMKISFKGVGDTHTGSYEKWGNIVKGGNTKNYIQVKTRNGPYGIRKVTLSKEEKNFTRKY